MAKMTRACALCAKPMWSYAKDGPAVCRPCRSAHPMVGRPHRPPKMWRLTCERCGSEFDHERRRTRYCSLKCTNSRRGLDVRPNRKVVRAEREQWAPGLRPKQRRKLLTLWKSKGRRCIYCDAPATTIDHVIPLAGWGGDNNEGNLAPCCLSCNSSKGDQLVVEWRYGRRLNERPAGSRPTPPPRKRKIGAARGTQLALSLCAICGGLHQGRGKVCGDRHCQRESAGRAARDHYRGAHGLAVDPTEPTLYWIRLHSLPDTRRWAPKAVA